jgi:hypothetical protein
MEVITRYWTSNGFGVIAEEEEEVRDNGLGSQMKTAASSHLSSLKQLATSKGEPFMDNFQSKIPDCMTNFSSFFK